MQSSDLIVKRRILIIDDYDYQRELFEGLFRDKHDVLTAENGTEALRLLQSYDIDLIILDIMLPDMSGVDVLRKIRSKSNIPVIITTGFGNKHIVLDCWREQATYYFDKPFRIGDVERVVNRFLSKETEDASPFRDPAGNSNLLPSIERATEFIIGNLKRKITLKEAASIASMNPSTFSVRFRQQRGISFQKFVARSKGELSKQMLSTTSKSIKEIALEIGFRDPLSFSKYFKLLTGLSPREYRRHSLDSHA